MQRLHSIEILPKSVVEKIAAGEVVERPAAVVKELIENSIDANASRLDITIEDAGFSLIKISDNGTGMPAHDLRRCMLHHATSKISAANDLFSIGTFGFRGEALGSIAAVSRMTVMSANDDTGAGLMLHNDGGTLGADSVPCSHRRGTTVIVRDLFFNVPARKKFMKSRRAEHLAIIRMLEQLVIPFSTTHFTLTMDGKRVFDLPQVDRCIDRIAAVTGTGFASTLIECRGEQESVDALIYVSSPSHTTLRPRFQNLYVNLRRINNDSVLYSVREAFSQFLGHDHRPAFFCFLNVDPARIDVNVHPTKQQIKFDDDRSIFSFVYATVKQGIGATMATARECADASVEPSPSPDTGYLADNSKDVGGVTPVISGAIPLPRHFAGTTVAEDSSGQTPFCDFASSSDDSAGISKSIQTILSFPDGKRVDKEVDLVQDNTVQLSGDVHEKMWDLIPCYQIHSMFVLAPIKNGILLIDQHAAHERILFEQAMDNSAEIRMTSQQLLFPIVLELSPAEKNIVESGNEHFRRFGFVIDDFGGQAISVSAIPAFIRDGMVESTIRDMVRYLLEGRNTDDFNAPHRRFAAAFACGAAIKAGQKLTQEEMNTLLNNLFAAKNPYICPHGRPTLVRMSIDEISRRFLR